MNLTFTSGLPYYYLLFQQFLTKTTNRNNFMNITNIQIKRCILLKALPKNTQSKDTILQMMDEARHQDAKWKDGRTFSLVYYAGEEISNLVKEAYMKFFHENGLNPMAFPSLQKFETEVLSMTTNLFHGDKNTLGSLTSGGSESILMAVKTYRDYARKVRPEVTEPEMILPISVHAAFEKAAHYFN